MNVQPFPSGPFETNAYVLACEHTGECAFVDPAPDSFQTLVQFTEENKLHPKMIFLTHSHWDHIADTAVLKNKFKIPVMIHPLDSGNLEQPGTDQLPCWISIHPVHPDFLLQEGEKLLVGKHTFEVIHTPGHTPGSICFYCKDSNILVSGDTLFKGTIGNLSFPTSQPKLMWNSLDKLAKLPSATRVFPGHGPSTTIGEEAWLPKAKAMFGNS